MTTMYFPFSLTLESPAILTQLEGDPNSSQTLNFVPGSSIRGAVAGALCSQGIDRSNPDLFRRLILSGEVKFLHAFIVEAGQRCLPTPASFRREKYGSKEFDLAGQSFKAGIEEDEDEQQQELEQLERLPHGFVTLGAADLRPGRVAISSRFHHQRDRQVGRATSTVGAIFRYVSLDSGQSFRGLLAIEAIDKAAIDSLFDKIRTALGTRILVGRSRRAGYGASARVTWEKPSQRETAGGRILTGDITVGQTFRVLATSDYLGRNPLGQFDPSTFEAEVATLLGGRTDEQNRQRFFEFRRVGGFNRTWGLQLPQAIALRAGSLLVLKATTPIRQEEWLALEHKGLGERRAEGFGRIAFLSAPGTEIRIEGTARKSSTLHPGGSPPLLITIMQQRLLDEAVDRAIHACAASLVKQCIKLPTASLLGKLRTPLRQHPPDRALSVLREWLAEPEAGERGREENRRAARLKKPARRQLEDCRLLLSDRQRTINLLDWLATMADPAGQSSTMFDLNAELGFSVIAQNHYLNSSESALQYLADSGQLATARVRFIDTVLAALARRVKRRLQESANADE